MATLEKPKKELRTKKTKIKQSSEALSAAAEELDKEPTCSVPQVKNIAEISCQLVHETKQNEETPEEEEEAANVELQEELQETAEQELPEPTAPPADRPEITPILLKQTEVLQYPNLQPLKLEESKAEVIYRTSNQRSPQCLLDGQKYIPLTEEQLKEFYYCPELELVHQFELEFLMNSLLETYESDPLHVLLLEYYNLQTKKTMIQHDTEECRKQIQNLRENIWIEVPIKKSYYGRCADGTMVADSVTYKIMQVDGKTLQSAGDSLQQVFDLVCYRYTTNNINTNIAKAKIDTIIDKIIAQPQLVQLANKSKSILLYKSLDNEILQCVAHLRRAISILFMFVRKLPPSKQFTKDLRCWLSKLISLQLLIATKEDHWFLLFNILRCPSGVGSWAATFLQVPILSTEQLSTNITSSGSRPSQAALSLNSAEMHHCISLLQILLLPIKKRNEYLQAYKDIVDPVGEDCWTFIDSDGEDSHTSTGDCSGLKENDLTALITQIPFEQLFMSALNVEKFLSDYIIQSDQITSNQVLRMIAFFSKLIDIFGEGMITYNTERYKQLAKRLGRLLRHTLQYASDFNEIFMQNKLLKDPATCMRINLELNVLLFRACNFIYRTRNLATWQYFSSLPFTSLSLENLWQIFYYLNVGFPTEFPTNCEDYAELFKTDDFWSKFNLANVDSSDEDLYYLLQAFFEIANGRDKSKDWEIIKSVCLQIFHIGFINKPTRESCYKTSRDMLINLTLVYEDLISCLLLQLKVRFSDIENATYLFKALPLENWKPEMDSFEVLSNWLLNYDFHSSESMLARLIISHLNWGFDAEEQRLFLPHNIHIRMACLICEALNKQAPEVIGIASFTDSVRQVSQFLDFTHTTKEQFGTWCWTMVSLLRLHLLDQSSSSIKRTIQHPTEPLMFVPELERLDLIYEGVTEQRPLAMFVAMLVTLHGHSIPLICQKGFELLKQLLNDYRHAAVVRCLELIVPLFLGTPETLGNCEGYQTIMLNLLHADKSYLKMAKDAIYSTCPVLDLLDNMIHNQIINYNDYGLATPLNLINVWLICLTSLPSWQNTKVVYLLDKILRVAYQFPDARPQAIEFFHNYYKYCDEWKGNNKKSALKSLFGTSCARIPTLTPEHAWLSFALLEIEFQVQDAKFWPEFLRQLAVADAKTTLDIVLKKTAATVQIAAFQPNMLVLYKYANLIANLNVSHPLFPIITQKFFEIYLNRVPLHYDDHRFQTTYGVSDKFYEYNVSLMKKIKTNLKLAETYQNDEAAKMADDEALSYFHRNCAKLMKTYMLWLEETNINKHSKDDQNLPPQYNVEKLREILNGNTTHWTEFIYLPVIRAQQKSQAEEWARRCMRSKTVRRLRTPPQCKRNNSAPLERIKTQLGSYDKIQPPPIYKQPEQHMVQDIQMKTFKEMQEKLKVLNSSAKKFHFQTCELSSLLRNYLDAVPQLYITQTYTQVFRRHCNWLLQICKGPAVISVQLEQSRINNQIKEQIDSLSEQHDKIINDMLLQEMDEFVRNYRQLAETVQLLLQKHAAAPNELQIITVTGINLFYDIIENLNDVTLKFPITNEFYMQILQDLGALIQDNQESEGLAILRLILKRSDLSKILYGVFMPARTKPEFFLPMYKFLIGSYLQRCDTKILFVLLSKFDLSTWLETFHPKLNEIDQLLQLVLRGLECWSKTEASLLQDQFRRHLVHIFNYDFPQHYGEVMQLLLDRISDQKLMPDVLLDTLNALFVRCNCATLSGDIKLEESQQLVAKFARQQNLFNLKASTETCMMFARHFQKERLQHGLHGLYPKHKDYCKPLAMWFYCFGHILVSTAICTYQELLADQICDTIFGFIVDMYAPWLITYTEKTLPEPTANWIHHLREQDQMLLPWSEQHAGTSNIMIKPFFSTLCFVLENLPTSHNILDHTFAWYVHHFAISDMEKYVHVPIQEGMASLPWEYFKPKIQYIDMLYDSLEKFIPECHAMLGHIFIRINWHNWFIEVMPTLHTAALQSHAVSRLFCIFVKLAFEPNIHMHTNLSRILEDAIQYPWHLVTYTELEHVFAWFVNTVDPSIVLKIPMDTNYADRAVLDLLQLVSAMRAQQPTSMITNHATAKRILYVRSYVQQLRLCAAKNHKLLASKDGINRYKAICRELIMNMDQTLKLLAGTQTHEECKREALNFLIEIIVPMQTQSEQTSNLQIEAMIDWQDGCNSGNVLLLSNLNAIGHMKAFISGIYSLLESTIVHYFRSNEEIKENHTPSWNSLMHELQLSLDKIELMPCIHGPYIHTLHVFIIYHMERFSNNGEKITFLQNLTQLIETIKISPYTEPRMAIVWGLIISRGSQILLESPHVKKPLLMLARQLHVLSSQSEGWGENLLGAIGLKKETITNKRRILTRCLACVIFSLFPNINSANELFPNQEYSSAMQELSLLLANKKFADLKPVIVQAIGIINEHKIPNFSEVPQLVTQLIGLFYYNNFLQTIPEIWAFDFKLT